MKIIITGATGFVGAALCRYYHQIGYQIIAMGRQATPPPALLQYARYLCADITTNILPFDADVCIHAAGLVSDTASYQSLYLNNVTGTANVLKAAQNCRYFIFISSSSVYNFTDCPAAEEDAQLNDSLSDYGKTKLLAEQLIHNNTTDKQKRLILRPRAIYGMGDKVLLPKVLKLIKGKRVFCPVDNDILTSATHVDNLAYAIGLFLNQPVKPNLQIFNIADDHFYQLRDIFLKICNAISGPGLKISYVPAALINVLLALNSRLHFSLRLSPVSVKALTKTSVLQLDHIKTTLGYKPTHIFDETIESIGLWVRAIGGKKAYLKQLSIMPWNFNKS